MYLIGIIIVGTSYGDQIGGSSQLKMTPYGFESPVVLVGNLYILLSIVRLNLFILYKLRKKGKLHQKYLAV